MMMKVLIDTHIALWVLIPENAVEYFVMNRVDGGGCCRDD